MAKLAIPTTPAEFQEMLSDPKMAAQIIQEGQLPEFVRAYAKATDDRGELAELVRINVQAAMAGSDEISKQVRENVRQVVSDLMGQQGVNRPNLVIPEPGTGAKRAASFNPVAWGTKLDHLGFVNIGEYARTIWHKNPAPGERMVDIKKVMNDYSSTDPSAGGFLIPETMRSDIMSIALEASIIRPRATVLTLTTPTQLVPYVDQSTNVGSVFGGMLFYWTPEAGDIQKSNARFGRMRMEANKLTGAAAVPNELWADAPALSSWLMQSMPRGIAFFEDLAFFNGSGAGEPLGLLNTEALMVIPPTSAAAGIQTQDVLNMYSRMLPSSLGSAVWIANQTTFTQLMMLKIDVGTGGAPVNLVSINPGPTMTLLGRPLILSEKVPARMAQGDLGFYDLTYYLVGDRQAVSLETSEHVYFLNDETALRIIERVDGRPWIQNPLQPVNGAPLSPFIVLGARTG